MSPFSMNDYNNTQNTDAYIDRNGITITPAASTVPGGMEAIGFAAFISFIEQNNIRPVTAVRDAAASAASFAAGLFRGRNYGPVEVRPEPADIVRLEELEEIMREVRRHQWIEAEKAGTDVWAQRNPHDPEAEALRDWVGKHYGTWRKSRRGRRVAA